MFARVAIGVSDRSASQGFYAAVLAALGIEPTDRDEWGPFALAPGAPVTRGLHIGFAAPSRSHVDAFWQAGVDGGWRDDGAPGPRPQYREDYYGGFLLDPDGNSAEAVHHGAVRPEAVVDHLWIRVPDVGEAKRFYERMAPRAGFVLGTDTPERVSFRTADGSFSLVAGTPTENLQLGFPAAAGAPGTETAPGGTRIELR